MFDIILQYYSRYDILYVRKKILHITALVCAMLITIWYGQ